MKAVRIDSLEVGDMFQLVDLGWIGTVTSLGTLECGVLYQHQRAEEVEVDDKLNDRRVRFSRPAKPRPVAPGTEVYPL